MAPPERQFFDGREGRRGGRTPDMSAPPLDSAGAGGGGAAGEGAGPQQGLPDPVAEIVVPLGRGGDGELDGPPAEAARPDRQLAAAIVEADEAVHRRDHQLVSAGPPQEEIADGDQRPPRAPQM